MQGTDTNMPPFSPIHEQSEAGSSSIAWKAKEAERARARFPQLEPYRGQLCGARPVLAGVLIWKTLIFRLLLDQNVQGRGSLQREHYAVHIYKQ